MTTNFNQRRREVVKISLQIARSKNSCAAACALSYSVHSETLGIMKKRLSRSLPKLFRYVHRAVLVSVHLSFCSLVIFCAMYGFRNQRQGSSKLRLLAARRASSCSQLVVSMKYERTEAPKMLRESALTVEGLLSLYMVALLSCCCADALPATRVIISIGKVQDDESRAPRTVLSNSFRSSAATRSRAQNRWLLRHKHNSTRGRLRAELRVWSRRDHVVLHL